MPNPTGTIDGAAPANWFADSPGGDLSLDDLFPNPETTPQDAPPPPPVEATPQPSADTVFLKTSTGTVYNSQEAAVQGTEEKDRLIAQMRQELTSYRGTDPLKKTPATGGQPPVDESLTRNPKKFFGDLVSAANAGDAEAYAKTLAQFQMELLSPYAPLLADVARERATRSAETANKGVREFIGSREYSEVLEQLPALKQAIEVAEADPQYAGYLEQYYKTAYLASLGARMPAIVEAAKATPAPQNPRPTLASSTPTPPAEPGGPTFRSANDALKSPEGRKLIIEQFEKSGAADKIW